MSGSDLTLGPLTAHVRSALARTPERWLGLELRGVTVVVDGLGG